MIRSKLVKHDICLSITFPIRSNCLFFVLRAELMLLGFISLLLTVGTRFIAKICIPAELEDTIFHANLMNIRRTTQMQMMTKEVAIMTEESYFHMLKM